MAGVLNFDKLPSMRLYVLAMELSVADLFISKVLEKEGIGLFGEGGKESVFLELPALP